MFFQVVKLCEVNTPEPDMFDYTDTAKMQSTSSDFMQLHEYGATLFSIIVYSVFDSAIIDY